MRVSIDDWLIFYVHSFACIFQSIKTFLVIRLSRTDASYHICIWISTKTILKNSGQFWVSVSDELRLFFINSQSWNNISKFQKSQIDTYTFFKGGTSCSSLFGPFRASKVNKEKLGSNETLIFLMKAMLLQENSKNGMRSWRWFVHHCGSCCSIDASLI